MTTEAVLWEWLNGLSDASTRGVAAEGYRRAHADARIEVVPFQPELIDSAVRLYRTRPDKDWSLTDCLSIEPRKTLYKYMASNVSRTGLVFFAGEGAMLLARG